MCPPGFQLNLCFLKMPQLVPNMGNIAQKESFEIVPPTVGVFVLIFAHVLLA